MHDLRDSGRDKYPLDYSSHTPNSYNWVGAGHRPSPDRAVLTADPHRRPRRGSTAPGVRRTRRLPHPHVGGDRHRRTEDQGDDLPRAARAHRAVPRGRRAGTLRVSF